MVLLAGGQQMVLGNVLQRGPGFVLAESPDCTDPNNPGCPEPGDGGEITPPAAPAPAPVEPTPVAPAPAPICDWVQKDPECDWNTHQVREVFQNSCTGAYEYRNQHYQDGVCGWPIPAAPAPVAPAPAAPVQPTFNCTRACDGQSICDSQNRSAMSLFANNEAGWVSEHESVVKAQGKCQPAQPAAPAAPAAPAPAPAAAPAPAVVSNNCLVCDSSGYADGQGRWRWTTCNFTPPSCQVNNSSTYGGCVGANAGDLCTTTITNPTCRSIYCPAAPANCTYSNQLTYTCDNNVTLRCGDLVCNPVVPPVTPPVIPPVVPPVVPITNNNCTGTNSCTSQGGNASASSGGSTLTVNVPAQAAQPAQVVLAQNQPAQQPAVVTVAGTTATAMPKTGLPMLAWAAAAFLPAGFKIKRFGKGIKSDEDNPNYLWESREYKRN